MTSRTCGSIRRKRRCCARPWPAAASSSARRGGARGKRSASSASLPRPSSPDPAARRAGLPGSAGSMTHCAGYRAAALAHTRDIAAIGIDAEPHGSLPRRRPRHDRQQGGTARARRPQAAAPETSWDKLLFSAKESAYKAWFPLTQRWLGFNDASVSINPADGTFTARLLVPGPVLAGRQLAEFNGRWLARDGLVITSIADSGRPIRATGERSERRHRPDRSVNRQDEQAGHPDRMGWIEGVEHIGHRNRDRKRSRGGRSRPAGTDSGR